MFSLYVATGFGIGMELGVDFNFNICNWRPVYVEIFVFYGIIGIILISLVYYRDHQRYLESKEEE